MAVSRGFPSHARPYMAAILRQTLVCSFNNVQPEGWSNTWNERCRLNAASNHTSHLHANTRPANTTPTKSSIYIHDIYITRYQKTSAYHFAWAGVMQNIKRIVATTRTDDSVTNKLVTWRMMLLGRHVVSHIRDYFNLFEIVIIVTAAPCRPPPHHHGHSRDHDHHSHHRGYLK